MDKKKGFWLLLFTSMIYGTFSILSKLIGKDLTGLQINVFINSLVIIIGVLYAAVRGIDLTINKNTRKYIFFYGVFFGLAATCFINAILSTKVATAIFAAQTSSLTVSLLTGMFIF